VSLGDSIIIFDRFEIFLCGTLPVYELGEERTVIADIDRRKSDGEIKRRDRMQSKIDERGRMEKPVRDL
jgi:hypothetical protein